MCLTLLQPHVQQSGAPFLRNLEYRLVSCSTFTMGCPPRPPLGKIRICGQQYPHGSLLLLIWRRLYASAKIWLGLELCLRLWLRVMVGVRVRIGNSVDKLRHPRSDAYSAAQVLLNKQQVWCGRAYLHRYLRILFASAYLQLNSIAYDPQIRILHFYPVAHAYQTICRQTNSWSVKLRTGQFADQSTC